MPFGRPTDYKPEYCEAVVKWGKLGKSKAWMCAELECTYKTIDTWAEANPDFLTALDIAMKNSQRWWEDTGQNGMLDKSIDASIYSRSMAARFPADWREKSEQTQTHNKGTGWDEIFGVVGNKSRSI